MKNKITKTKEKFNLSVLLIITLGGTTAGIYRNGIMTLFPFLQIEYSLSRTQVGFYSTFLYLSSILAAVFSGWIADQWGVKRSMIGGLSCMGLFIFLHTLAPNFLIIIILATLTGFGLSIILPTASKGIAEWFSSRTQTTAMGIMTLGFSLGGVLGASLLPWSANYFNWRISVIILGLLYLLISLLFFFYNNKTNKGQGEKRTVSLLIKDITALFKNKYLIALCMLGIMFGVASGIIVTHFTLYLFLDFGFTEIKAGLGFMILQIGSMIGRPGWGILNDKLFKGKEKVGFSIIAILIGIISIIFALLNRFNPSIPLILFLGFVFGSVGRGWQGLYFSAVSEQVGMEDTGTAVGLSLVFVRAGIAIGPPIFGFIADQTGSYSYSWFFLAAFIFTAITIGNHFLTKKF